MPRPDSSVVERGPEKAGVGGSIPSLATTHLLSIKIFSEMPTLTVPRLLMNGKLSRKTYQYTLATIYI
jgi:hypothetical protein